ncbi:hypothetical protein [Sphaerisporangium dianthi]|uniref:Uncharacterized protein n=1 Tax=Sphaerisporangium dianthi TaxID=1436120 RepID=A0ABV9CA81_9ACTN
MPTVERPLSAAEQAVILTLLQEDLPGVEELRTQVSSAVVTRHCKCGCATVDLDVTLGPHTVAAPVEDGVLITATVRGRLDGVLLFVENGRLSCLEIYAVEGEPAPLPRPEDLMIDPRDPGTP